MPNRPLLLIALLLASCAPRPAPTVAPIDAAAIARHVEILASDAYEGRAPGTAGETRTVEYIVAAFEKAGLRPGNRASWFQDVPLVEVMPSSAAVLIISGAKGGAAFEWGEDALVGNSRAADAARLDRSELLFAGYGLTVPERG
ncbi:MAG: peptidase M28, partial [Sphingomonadaceae bacterium]|nr:peptidase M28 [Sphingomonadaceae bacterium]